MYHQLIDMEYIRENQEMSCVRDPADLYDYLSEHFDRVIVEEGQIKISYVWGKTIIS